MKKLGMLLGLLLLFQTGYSAENNSPVLTDGNCLFLNHLRIVAAAGVTNENGAPSYDYAIGGFIGIESVLLRLLANVVMKSGIILTNQGATYDENTSMNAMHYSLKSAQSTVEEFSGTVRLTYLNVPVLFNYQSDMGIYGEVGLQPGLLLSAKDKYDGGSSDFKESAKTFNLGLPIGVGYAVNDKISVGVRSVIGITDNIEEMDYMGASQNSKEFMLVGIVKIKLNTK